MQHVQLSLALIWNVNGLMAYGTLLKRMSQLLTRSSSLLQLPHTSEATSGPGSVSFSILIMRQLSTFSTPEPPRYQALCVSCISSLQCMSAACFHFSFSAQCVPGVHNNFSGLCTTLFLLAEFQTTARDLFPFQIQCRSPKRHLPI